MGMVVSPQDDRKTPPAFSYNSNLWRWWVGDFMLRLSEPYTPTQADESAVSAHL